MVFPCVGAKNQILGCETSEECLLDVILVASLEATGLGVFVPWVQSRQCSSEDKAAAVHQLGRILANFRVGYRWRVFILESRGEQHATSSFLVKVKILFFFACLFYFIDIDKVILRF